VITNCEHCTKEVDDEDIGMCDVCGQDGLCPDCQPHDFHRKRQPYLLVEGMLGLWLIVHEDMPALAWSGSRWVPHRHGVPAGDVQVCNFPTREAAQEYVNKHFNEFFPPKIWG
jgi:hypothetical protein